MDKKQIRMLWLAQYNGAPCDICGNPITEADIETAITSNGPNAIAHAACWEDRQTSGQAYDIPKIIHELELETRAGSPIDPFPDPLDVPE